MNSCLNCENRRIGCHNTCSEYFNYKAEIEKIRGMKCKENDVRQFELCKKIRVSRRLGGFKKIMKSENEVLAEIERLEQEEKIIRLNNNVKLIDIELDVAACRRLNARKWALKWVLGIE